MTSSQVIGFIASVVNHGGGNVDDITLSKSSCLRQRAAARSQKSKQIKESFSCEDVCQVNFDSKLVKELEGHRLGKVNRLAVTLQQESGTKILKLAKTEDSTGETEAASVTETLEDWNVTSKVIAVGFDTTTSNTGVNKGVCIRLQKSLKTPLLWMACRHHVLELILGKAFSELFGESSGPEIPLFKKLQDVWYDLDLTDLILPDIPPYLQNQSAEILTFVEERLKDPNSTPRDDYKELLELAKIFLGGSVSRKRGYVYQFQTPGALHHARWMAKAIYILKMSLLQHQLKSIHHTRRTKLTKMALLIVFVYLKPWFSVGSVTRAEASDLNLLKSLISYKAIDKKVSASCCTVLQRHTWYLTEENIPFSLFNDDISLSERQQLADAIVTSATNERLGSIKPNLPQITADSELHSFAGPRSKLMFNLMSVPLDLLRDKDWHLTPQYSSVKVYLKNLSSINESAERAISLLSMYNTRITKNEDSFQDLLQVVECHRSQFSVASKKDLKKFY